MAHSGLCCGLFRGTFYLKDLSVPNSPLLSVGNAEAAITQEMTEIVQPNFQSLGGNNCKVEYVESMSLDLTLHCTSPENLAMAFMGQHSQLTPSSVVDELHAVNSIDELIPLAHIPLKSVPIVVEEEGGGNTYVLGEDYIVMNSGIKIIEGSTIPVDGSEIQISYSYGANYRVDMQTVSQKEYYVFLDGFNAGESGQRPFAMQLFKVKFAPTESFDIISGTEFASLALSGEILRDDSKVTGSKFGTMEYGSETNGTY